MVQVNHTMKIPITSNWNIVKVLSIQWQRMLLLCIGQMLWKIWIKKISPVTYNECFGMFLTLEHTHILWLEKKNTLYALYTMAYDDDDKSINSILNFHNTTINIHLEMPMSHCVYMCKWQKWNCLWTTVACIVYLISNRIE